MNDVPIHQKGTFEEINQKIWEHLKARDWHTNKPRGLAISLVLEASELLEHYQWNDKAVGGDKGIGEELADVLIYAFQIAQQHNIDIVDVIEQKLENAAKKYPAENFKGKKGKDQNDAWIASKLAHTKTGL